MGVFLFVWAVVEVYTDSAKKGKEEKAAKTQNFIKSPAFFDFSFDGAEHARYE